MEKNFYKLKLLKAVGIAIVLLITLALAFLSSPSLFHVFSLAMFVLTIGAMLEAKKTWFRVFLKYLIYILYFVYTILSIGILEGLFSLEGITLQDWDKVLYGVIAPIALIVLMKVVLKLKIRGHKIFNYFVLWIFFLIFALIWDVIYPEDILIEFLILYWLTSLIIVYSFKRKGGY